MIRACPGLVAAFAVFASPAAIACSSPLLTADAGAFKRFALGHANLAEVHDVIRKQIASFPSASDPSACTAVAFSEKDWQLVYMQDIRMDLDRNIPVAGAKWAQLATTDICGTSMPFQVLNRVREDGTIERTAQVPGNTLTNWPAEPASQRQAIEAALHSAARAMPSGCEGGTVINTAVVKMDVGRAVALICSSYDPRVIELPPGTQILMPPSKEKWTVSACGQRIDVTLQFTRSEKQTRVEEIDLEVEAY